MAGINIILYEKNRLLSGRIKNILQIVNDVFYEAFSMQELQEILFETQGGSRIVIADTDGERDGGISFIRGLKKNVGDSPVIVLSSDASRKYFFDIIKLGASDFILKPFEDKAMKSKLENYLSVRNSENTAELVTFNFARYLSGEIRKAQKGKYVLSMMFITYLTKNSVETASDTSLIDRYIFDNLQSLFWDTDVFIRFGKKYFIGVFPFCTVKNTKILSDKIQSKFSEMKKSYAKLSGYELPCIFVTYPDDAQDASLLSWLLMQKARAVIDEDITLVF